MAWVDTASETFVARHDERDADDADRVLAQLEFARARLEERFDPRPGELAVVLHSSLAQLDAAQPWLPLARRLTAPAARRYVVGVAGRRELHVLCPRQLAHRASNVEGSLEMLMLAPSALLARRYVAGHHPQLPPPATPGRLARWSRWAWLVEGAAPPPPPPAAPPGRAGGGGRRGGVGGGRRAVALGAAPPRPPSRRAAPARRSGAVVPALARGRPPARRNGLRPAGARGRRSRL